MSQSIPEVPATLSESDEARQDMPKSEKLNRECGRWDSCAFSLILLIFNTNSNILFTISPSFIFFIFTIFVIIFIIFIIFLILSPSGLILRMVISIAGR